MNLRPLARQLSSFVGVGFVSTALHYAVLVTLVQIFRVSPVPAAVAGCTAGALLSYGLNRKHTFDSERPHEEAAWRFGLVAGVAFVLTYVFMRQFVEIWGIQYLVAQGITTLIVMTWTFLGNLLWTFRKAL